jgi:hypothetical protein
LIKDSRTVHYEKAISVDKAEYIFGLSKNGADDQIFSLMSARDALQMRTVCLWSISKSICVGADASTAALMRSRYTSAPKRKIPCRHNLKRWSA